MLKVSIEEELKSDHPEQYANLISKKFPKKLPNFVIKFFDVMESLTDEPTEWLLKLRGKL